jgi:hypothetical protein
VTDERPAEAAAPGAASKLPPFKARPLPGLVQPLVQALPGAAPAGEAVDVASTLLFNDVSDDALVCDPNDPDCEVV